MATDNKAKPTRPRKAAEIAHWDIETEVAIVGFGGAGSCAAIEAADAGLELENEDSWWWYKRNSERVFNNAKTAEDRKTEVTVMWNRWRSQLFSWHPNTIALRPSGNWPLWSWRTLGFYGASIPLWFAYFFVFTWLRNRTDGK